MKVLTELGEPVVKYLKLFNCKAWNRSHSVDWLYVVGYLSLHLLLC
ncbi:hypothetical protein E2320_001960 [Naja naja]|nr:hypothetical protein E2320_001960 [Naja naja]